MYFLLKTLFFLINFFFYHHELAPAKGKAANVPQEIPNVNAKAFMNPIISNLLDSLVREDPRPIKAPVQYPFVIANNKVLTNEKISLSIKDPPLLLAIRIYATKNANLQTTTTTAMV